MDFGIHDLFLSRFSQYSLNAGKLILIHFTLFIITLHTSYVHTFSSSVQLDVDKSHYRNNYLEL